MEKKEFIAYVKKQLPDSYYDCMVFEKDGKFRITLIVKTDPENLNNLKADLIKRFGLEDAVFVIEQKIPAPKQSWEERDRLIEMSHSDADPGL